MDDYFVTLIQSRLFRIGRVTAGSATEAARMIHAAKDDPSGTCYSVQGPGRLDQPRTVQVLPRSVRVMPD